MAIHNSAAPPVIFVVATNPNGAATSMYGGSRAFERASAYVETVDVVHDLSADLDFSKSQEKSVFVPPGRDRGTLVKVRSHVRQSSSAEQRSPAYLAARRRIRVRKIRETITGLDAQSARDDFFVAAFPVFQEIEGALAELQPAQTEGNSREILRQVRDSLTCCGWEQYRVAAVRRAVDSVLEALETKDSVVPGDTKLSFATLSDAGLRPVIFSLSTTGEGQVWDDDETESDEEEKMPG
jgi:hypothetical protein